MIWIIAFFCILLDQFTKAFAVKMLVFKSVPVIQNVFHLTYVENTGIAFGMFQRNNLFFIIASFIILISIIFAVIKYKPTSKLIKISAGFVVGGAVGNLIDRMLRGFVVDFLDFRLINFPVFNIADSCVVVGAIIFVIHTLFFDKKVDEIAEN